MQKRRSGLLRRSNSLKRPCGTSGNATYRRICPSVEYPYDDSHFMLCIWSSLTKSEFSHSPMIDDFLAIGTRGYAIAVDLSCSSDALTVVLDDGRTVSVVIRDPKQGALQLPAVLPVSRQ